MKKVLGILLCMTLLLSSALLFGCAKNKETPLKLGLGVSTVVSATNATAEKDGVGQVNTTAAAVLIDNDGKVVKAFIDCTDNKLSYTAEGKAVTNESFKTKYELGYEYNMKKYGSAKEWFEQADAFCSLIVGKNVTEIKALVAAENKGSEEVINAGCTITVDEFVKAVEKAIANAVDSEATEKDTLKLGISTNQSVADATAEKNGSNQGETTFFAAAINADGKVVAATSDCVQVKFTFNSKGESTFDTAKTVSSKKEAGADYGMTKYGAAKEWFEQAAAFDAACVGKTVAEIKALMGADNKGVTDIQNAGCTILVDGFVKAASKIG